MLNKKIGLIALLTSVAASGVMAQGSITSYAVGDVLVCFRGGAGSDMVVDAGSISTFTNATHNQRITITQYTGTQLAQVGTNSVSWSAFTWLGDNTLFMTRARTSLNLQSTPWVDSGSSQAGVVNQMVTIPPGALEEYNEGVYPVSSSTAVVEENDSNDNPNYPDGQSYFRALTGAYGSDWDGKFQGNPEGTTSSTFVRSSTVVRSDFYQLPPSSSGQGIWLGYFEFNTNGVMTFVAKPTTQPVLNTFSRSGNIATINYKTGLYGSYYLLGTNNMSAPLSTWPVLQTLNTGDTLGHSIQDTETTNNLFYIIQGQ